MLLGIDEAHVLVPWGHEFHIAYHQIGSLHKWLPQHVARVAVTATLAPGKDFTALLEALQLGGRGYHCVRLSSERQNVCTVVSELSRGLNGYVFLTLTLFSNLVSRLLSIAAQLTWDSESQCMDGRNIHLVASG